MATSLREETGEGVLKLPQGWEVAPMVAGKDADLLLDRLSAHKLNPAIYALGQAQGEEVSTQFARNVGSRQDFTFQLDTNEFSLEQAQGNSIDGVLNDKFKQQVAREEAHDRAITKQHGRAGHSIPASVKAKAIEAFKGASENGIQHKGYAEEIRSQATPKDIEPNRGPSR